MEVRLVTHCYEIACLACAVGALLVQRRGRNEDVGPLFLEVCNGVGGDAMRAGKSRGG